MYPALKRIVLPLNDTSRDSRRGQVFSLGGEANVLLPKQDPPDFRKWTQVMSEHNNNSSSSEALERTLNELLASELVLDGRNGRELRSTVESVVNDLLGDGQLKNKLMGETKVGFGMALGKFLAWKVWTEIEKSDKKKVASKDRPCAVTLKIPQERLLEVKKRWPNIRAAYFSRVGFPLPELTLEPVQECWSLELRAGLLEQRSLGEDWFEPLLQFLADNASRLLTMSMVKDMVDEVRAEHPVFAEEMERLRVPLTTIYKVLESLLEEAVSIREMETILTALLLSWEGGPDRQGILSSVRAALSPWICAQVQVRPGVLRAVKVGKKIEDMFSDSVRYHGSEQSFALEPQQRALVIALVRKAMIQFSGSESLVLLTSQRIRQEVRRIVRDTLPRVVVLSEAEIHRGMRVEVVAIVDLKQPSATEISPQDVESALSF